MVAQLLVILSLVVTQTAHAPRAAGKVDACALLTSDEVQRVLGQTVKEQQAGTQPARDLVMSQCFFGTGTARSVSIAIAVPGARGRSAMTPKKYWQQQFHPEAGGRRPEAKGGREEKEREGEANARSIAGVGDEAYWSGTHIAGALYVLKGDRFIRVSVGGIRDEPERIEKSKALAAAALKRF